MFEEDRIALETLKDEMHRMAVQYLPLYHEQLLLPDFLVFPNEWQNFAAANPSAPGVWQEWHGPHDGLEFEWFGRFFGSPDGLREFKEVAESLSLVLNMMEPGFAGAKGFAATLELIHHIAVSWPTPLLRSAETTWNTDKDVDCDRSNLWSDVTEEQELYPLHPFVETISNNLFVATKQAIQLVLDPESGFYVAEKHFFEPHFPGQDKVDEDEFESPTSPECCDTVAEKEERYSFEFDSETQYWSIQFQTSHGELRIKVRDQLGYRYMAFMLLRRGERVPCLEVVSPQSGTLGRSSVTIAEYGGTEPTNLPLNVGTIDYTIDCEAQRQLYQRVREIADELLVARSESDEIEEQRLMDEQDTINRQLNSDINIYGRPRKLGRDTPERYASMRVRSSIDRATKKLVTIASSSDPRQAKMVLELVEHLSQIEVTGGDCLYLPKTALEWVVKRPASTNT